MSNIYQFKNRKQQTIDAFIEDKDQLKYFISTLIEMSNLSTSNTIQITMLDDKLVIESKNYFDCNSQTPGVLNQDCLIRILQIPLLDEHKTLRPLEQVTDEMRNGLKQIKYDASPESPS